jgi:hypothetical protein
MHHHLANLAYSDGSVPTYAGHWSENTTILWATTGDYCMGFYKLVLRAASPASASAVTSVWSVKVTVPPSVGSLASYLVVPLHGAIEGCVGMISGPPNQQAA